MPQEIKNDFIAMYKAIEPIEQEAFDRYINYFYGQQKVILETFEKVVQAVADHEEITFLFSIKNNKTALNSLSDLKKWLLEFLTLQELKSNSYKAQFLTLDALGKRGFNKILRKKSAELTKELTTKTDFTMWLSFLKLQLDHDDYFNIDNEKLDNLQDKLVCLMDNLDSFYISTKLKYSVEMQSRSTIRGEHYQPRLLNDICLLAEQDNALNPVIQNLYLPLWVLVKDKSEAAFYKLKTFLIDNPQYDTYEKLLILMYLLNFATFNIMSGNTVYQHELLYLAKLGSEKSIFTAAGHFPIRTFNNIINVGCHLKESAWTNQFIDKWAIYINPKDKLIVEHLAIARVAFADEKFQNAIDYLWKIEHYKNKHYTLDIRILLARACYEQKIEIDRQNSYCDSLESYIRRNIEHVNLQTNTLNFVKILRFLLNGKSKQELLKGFKEKEKNIVCGEWLKAKIEERKQ